MLNKSLHADLASGSSGVTEPAPRQNSSDEDIYYKSTSLRPDLLDVLLLKPSSSNKTKKEILHVIAGHLWLSIKVVYGSSINFLQEEHLET